MALKRWLATGLVAVALAGSGCGLGDLLRGTDEKADQAEEGDSESDESDDSESNSDEVSPRQKKKKKKKKRSEPSAESASPRLPRSPFVPLPQEPKSPPFSETATVPVFLTAKLGAPIRVHMLALHPHHAVVEVESTEGGVHVDRYLVRDGRLRVHGKPEPAARDSRFAKRGFDFASVDLSRLNALMADAKVQLGYANPEVSHVIVRRPLPFHDDVRWRVFVTGEEGSGSVEYLLDGALGKIYK